jgi:hypothetical protein
MNDLKNERYIAAHCPHLGLVEDPTTILAYPSQGNVCHAAGRCAAIEFVYQRQRCLVERYVDCPVWQNQPGAEPPAPVEEVAELGDLRRRWFTAAGVLLAMAAALVILGSWNWEAMADFSFLRENGDDTAVSLPIPTLTAEPTTTPIIVSLDLAAATAVATHTPMATQTPSPTETPTAVPPTPTTTPTNAPSPMPSLTATPTPIPLPQAVIIVERLNVRVGPSTLYNVLDVVLIDEQFDIVGRNNAGDWWQICCFNGERGWVFAESVTAVGDTADTPIITNIPPPEESEQ